MPLVHLVPQEEAPPTTVTTASWSWLAWGYLVVGAVLMVIIGT